MMRLSRGCLQVGLLVPILSLAACGPRQLPKEETYPVRGRVMLSGQPARYVLIRFEPAEATSRAVEANGFTGEDGSFTLRTYSNDTPDGAIPGTYRVVLEPYDPVRAGPIPPGAVPLQLAAEYDTKMTVEVKEGDNELEIDIP